MNTALDLDTDNSVNSIKLSKLRVKNFDHHRVLEKGRKAKRFQESRSLGANQSEPSGRATGQ